MPNHSKSTIPIGIARSVTLLHIERASDHWRLWISFDRDMQHGTFYQMNDDGSMQQVTVRQDEGDEIIDIKR